MAGARPRHPFPALAGAAGLVERCAGQGGAGRGAQVGVWTSAAAAPAADGSGPCFNGAWRMSGWSVLALAHQALAFRDAEGPARSRGWRAADAAPPPGPPPRACDAAVRWCRRWRWRRRSPSRRCPPCSQMCLQRCPGTVSLFEAGCCCPSASARSRSMWRAHRAPPRRHLWSAAGAGHVPRRVQLRCGRSLAMQRRCGPPQPPGFARAAPTTKLCPCPFSPLPAVREQLEEVKAHVRAHPDACPADIPLE